MTTATSSSSSSTATDDWSLLNLTEKDVFVYDCRRDVPRLGGSVRFPALPHPPCRVRLFSRSPATSVSDGRVPVYIQNYGIVGLEDPRPPHMRSGQGQGYIVSADVAIHLAHVAQRQPLPNPHPPVYTPDLSLDRGQVRIAGQTVDGTQALLLCCCQNEDFHDWQWSQPVRSSR